MEKVSILLLMKNNAKCCEETIELVRETAVRMPQIQFEVIVLDILSDEFHGEIIRTMEDVTYISLERDEIAFGSMIQMVVKELQIQNDFLIIDGGLVPEQDSLKTLIEMMEQADGIGTIAPRFHSCEMNVLFEKDVKSYQEAQEQYYNMQKETYEVLATEFGAVGVLWKSYVEAGGFDCRLQSALMTLRDFQLSLLRSGRKNVYALNTFFRGKIESTLTLNDSALVQMDQEYIGSKWGMHYFNMLPNRNITASIQKRCGEKTLVLEVGCDCGATLLDIKNRIDNACVYGLELNEPAALIASCFSETIVGNIESDGIPFENTKFDDIIFGDVLEHLHDPERVLTMCKDHLNEGGYIVANIPNVQHISVLHQLIHGRFEYQDSGLLDRTHIHFFTQKEIEAMFTRAGYRIESIASIFFPLPQVLNESIQKLKSLFPDANENMMRTFQYLVKARCLSDSSCGH